jgi:hypothetical protein
VIIETLSNAWVMAVAVTARSAPAKGGTAAAAPWESQETGIFLNDFFNLRWAPGMRMM